VVGELADDEQPATAAMPMNAAAMASLPAPEFGERPAFENTGLENTDMPFTRVAPGTAFSNYDDDKVIAVGATPTGQVTRQAIGSQAKSATCWSW
jgi:hypothetical protein